MPEQSAGGSLTQRPLTPHVERPAQLGAAVDAWRRALAGSGLPDTLVTTGPQARASWLELTHAHPSGLAQLFAGRPTRLSSLFREPEAHDVAWNQVRMIRRSAIVLSAQRGVQACCLSIGVATWRPDDPDAPGTPGDLVHAPVVLRACSIRPRGGESDFDLDLDDAVLINPELIRILVEEHGIEADGAELAALANGDKGFDPRPVYSWLEEHCGALRGFAIERSLVLATFAAGSGAVLADLDAALPAIAANELLRSVAEATTPAVIRLPGTEGGGEGADSSSSLIPHQKPGAQQPGPGAPGGRRPEPEPRDSRRLAVVGRLGPRGARPVSPPKEADPADELLVLDCDPAQTEAVTAALRGEHLVIEGPPGSGATHTLAAAIAGLVASGRRVLILSPRRASTETLLSRLHQAGIGELVLDLRDSPGGRPATRTAPLTATLTAALSAATGDLPRGQLPPVGKAALDDDSAQTVRRARALLDDDVTALHEVRRPWGVSAYDAMVALADLTADSGAAVSGAGAGGVRLGDEVLNSLDGITRERVRAHLHAAAAAGAFTLTRTDTRWYDAQVTTNAQAHKALEAALVLRAGLRRTRIAMDGVTAAAGLRPATTAEEWLPLLNLLLGVREVVDSMLPQLFEAPLARLALAVAPRTERPTDGSGPGRVERRRLRRQAQGLVRPGVSVPDLYRLLGTAQDLLNRWHEYALTPSTPRVVVGLTEASATVSSVTGAIAVLAETFAGTPTPDLRSMPLDDLEQRIADLAADTQGILGQPRRARLLQSLRDAGLAELVDDLRTRRIGPDAVDGEFDLSWWSSVRDSIVRSDPRLAGHDPLALRTAATQLRAAETDRIRTGSALVRTAVTTRAAKAVAAQPEQMKVLRTWLTRDDSRPRLSDLVRRCGDVLSALTPVWVMSPDTVAACLAPADPDVTPVVDTVVVDDAGHIGLPEVVAALARGAQVIVAGDRRRLAPPDGSKSVVESLAPFARVCRLDRDHRTVDGRMLLPLAPRYPEGWQQTPGIGVHAPLFLEAVADGIAIPPPGEELPVSADGEVARVIDLVERHALRHPEQSLIVITLSERHAERIEESLRISLPERTVLAQWLSQQRRAGLAEPFTIRPVQRLLGIERDAAIVSIGLARTPHGRVLHRFGVLDGDKGAAALTTAVSRSRHRTTVVCCFTADDMLVDRLRTAGARLLRDVLLAAGGRGTGSAGRMPKTSDALVTDLRDRLAAVGLPVRMRVWDGAWPLDIAVADPRVPGRMLVAVDLDGPAFASRNTRERERHRPGRWERAGWAYCRISAMDLFTDPDREVARVREVWEAAMTSPLPPEAYAVREGSVPGLGAGADVVLPDVSAPEESVPDAVRAEGSSADGVLPDVAGPGAARLGVAGLHVAGPDVAGPDVTGAAATGPDVVLPDVAGQNIVLPDVVVAQDELDLPEALSEDVPPSIIDLSRQVFSGAVGPEDDEPAFPDRSDDDRDEGWGDERSSGRDDDILRERPPHWD
ncbi:hypothetical protein KIH74_17250 [Kineosporia sp. J2-2]|uniref:Restriction endonuclease type II-like domain-containing protein n=1 Tax=Kineosporia corallincola TaxID=2835133 RepID=A0ABS5TM63_9ACTN|nr:hypothetical protein [Kineosporia corallincola]MBT0770694.1 hypothetical protein [Kineosporia corallincola]